MFLILKMRKTILHDTPLSTHLQNYKEDSESEYEPGDSDLESDFPELNRCNKNTRREFVNIQKDAR